jgi:hypothetical protein
LTVDEKSEHLRDTTLVPYIFGEELTTNEDPSPFSLFTTFKNKIEKNVTNSVSHPDPGQTLAVGQDSNLGKKLSS